MTASNAAGSASATSLPSVVVTAAVATPPANAAAPAISGQAVQGQTLSTTAGSWRGNPTSFAYRWEDCNSAGAACTAIAGARGATYVLAGSDVGHTVAVAVTATNAAGSATATSAATAVVGAASKGGCSGSGCPASTAAPRILDPDVAPIEGQTVPATNGTWSGSPTSFTYQWQRCAELDANCANIAGATRAGYTLAAADVGENIQLVVTASNASGSASAISNYTPAIAPDSSACTTKLNPTQSDGGGTMLEQALSAAAGGSVICLNAGDYDTNSGISAVADIDPSSNVTVQPTPGAHVELGWLDLGGDVNNVTFQGFSLDGGVSAGSGSASNLIFRGNIIDGNYDGATSGFYFYGQSQQMKNIEVLNNEIDNLAPTNLSSTGAGQCLTDSNNSGEGHDFVFSHNVCGPDIANHYTQYAGIDGLTEDYNSFLGPVAPEALTLQEHNNVIQIFGSDSDNIDFSNNYIWHTDSRAQTMLFEEAGFSAVTINNNLDVNDPGCLTNWNCYTAFFQGCLSNPGFTFTNNTVVDAAWNTLVTNSESDSIGSCFAEHSSGEGYNVTHNIFVHPDGAQPSGYAEVNYAECTSNCVFDYNVTDDGTADQGGSTHYDANWKPAFADGSSDASFRSWYQDPTGLAFQAGYVH